MRYSLCLNHCQEGCLFIKSNNPTSGIIDVYVHGEFKSFTALILIQVYVLNQTAFGPTRKVQRKNHLTVVTLYIAWCIVAPLYTAEGNYTALLAGAALGPTDSSTISKSASICIVCL